MLRDCFFSVVALGITGMLGAGCASVHRPRARSASEESSNLRTADILEEKGLNKLAEAHAHYSAGVIHQVNNEPQKALEEFYKAALDYPDNETLILEVSRRFLQSKEPEKALELLTRAASQPNASGAIFARLGAVYSQLGKYDQAVAADRTAIKKSPESLGGYQNLFLNYLQTKRPQEALKILDEAARQAHPDLEFLLNLAELYDSFALQNPSQKEAVNAKALALLNRAEKFDLSNPAMRLKLADGFNAAGATAKAATSPAPSSARSLRRVVTTGRSTTTACCARWRTDSASTSTSGTRTT